jgi:hypothetical protein
MARQKRHRTRLSWKDPNAAKGIHVDHFNIYRADATGQGGSAVCVAWNPIGTVPARVKRYVDETVVGGNRYCYAVTSVNSYGESAKSVLVVVTVPP